MEMDAGDFGLIMDALGAKFQNDQLLSQAFVHDSFVNESLDSEIKSNERLEFLGDRVVNLVIAEELYARLPDWSEGRLSEAHSVLVRTESLARVSKSLGLGQHLKLGKGEEGSGGNSRPSNLEAVFEAVVGAVFLDQGYICVQRFILNVMGPEIDDVIAGDRPLKDPKTRLQELVHVLGMALPVYRVVNVVGRDHERTFTVEVIVEGKVEGISTGRSKLVAEQLSAEQALQSLRRL